MGELVKRVGEADKNGMPDFIFSFPSSFFATPPLCSKEKVSQKQHLRVNLPDHCVTCGTRSKNSRSFFVEK